ncbi:MAG: hypothetical protein EXR07_16840 [Acetobacteraceae bacterium]|nr:hypothetical protein [Acetobacteraceae bacterium]
MAKSPKSLKQPAAARGGGRATVWLSGLACGVLAAIAPGTALVAGCLLAPGIVALKLDREPGRPVARTVLTCGLAGCVQPIITLWNAGQSLDTAFAIVADPGATGVAWSAAAAGWLMTQLIPLGVRAALEATALTRATRLRASRARIAEAWGLEGTGEDS